jgi:hypothetical protein
VLGVETTSLRVMGGEIGSPQAVVKEISKPSTRVIVGLGGARVRDGSLEGLLKNERGGRGRKE